jgi:hypothetical protein
MGRLHVQAGKLSAGADDDPHKRFRNALFGLIALVVFVFPMTHLVHEQPSSIFLRPETADANPLLLGRAIIDASGCKSGQAFDDNAFCVTAYLQLLLDGQKTEQASLATSNCVRPAQSILVGKSVEVVIGKNLLQGRYVSLFHGQSQLFLHLSNFLLGLAIELGDGAGGTGLRLRNTGEGRGEHQGKGRN